MIVNFYAIYKDTTLKILLHLLEKTLDINKKALIVVKNQDQATLLDNQLWEKSLWLPHCLLINNSQMQTPIIITTELEALDLDNKENSNQTINNDYLFVINDSDIENTYNYEKLFIIFNANDDIILNYNRKRWQKYKQLQLNLNFYKQNNDGKFEKQNI